MRLEKGNAYISRLGQLKEPSNEIYCGESGTTLRFMTGICATTPHDAQIVGGPSLLRRPVKELTIALQKLGAYCTCDQGYPPVHVRGPIQGGSVRIPGNVSSQYVSALLLAAPLAEMPVEVAIEGRLESRSYVEMTLDMQRKFGVRLDEAEDLARFRSEPQTYGPSDVEIEGDWSSAAFLLVATAMAGEKVTVDGLVHNSRQADRYLLHIIENMNGRVKTGANSVTVERAQLKPIKVDVAQCPDLFPAICALCAMTDGVSTITGIRRLRTKESDRVMAMRNGLNQIGIETRESENSLTIRGGKSRSAVIDPHRDHRIAMAFATLGLCTDEVTIVDAECVRKSYPSFWHDLQSLGGAVTAH